MGINTFQRSFCLSLPAPEFQRHYLDTDQLVALRVSVALPWTRTSLGLPKTEFSLVEASRDCLHAPVHTMVYSTAKDISYHRLIEGKLGCMVGIRTESRFFFLDVK